MLGLEASPVLFECRHETLRANETQRAITTFFLLSREERWVIFGRPRQDGHLKLQTSRAHVGSSKPAWLQGAEWGCHVWHQSPAFICVSSRNQWKTSYPTTSSKHCLFLGLVSKSVTTGLQLQFGISGSYSFRETIREFSGMLRCCIANQSSTGWAPLPLHLCQLLGLSCSLSCPLWC